MPLESTPRNSTSFSLLTVNSSSLLNLNFLTSMLSSAISSFIKSSQSAFTLTQAYLSRGVACRLTMMSLPSFPTVFGISAAGLTVKELPIVRQTSAISLSSRDLVSSYSGRVYPKLMMESCRVLPHYQHLRDVAWSCTCVASRVRKSLRNLLLQLWHFYNILFPCSSANFSGLKPDRRWSPSVFCETKNFSNPFSYKVTKDIWVKDGRAFLLSTMFLLGSFSLTPMALFSQTPAPVLSTVFIPDLKSGIPQAVEMPAPVKAIK